MSVCRNLSLSVFLLGLCISSPASAFAKGCSFSESRQQFAGTPLEQAECLLRKVRPGGSVDPAKAVLPAFLQAHVGKSVELSKSQLRAYLKLKGIADREIGGTPDKGVSSTERGTRATYFVIHDTSDEVGERFPSNINESSWAPNRLNDRDISMAHLFVSRTGSSLTGHEYSEAWRATKRERDTDGVSGLFLHHELVQPRIRGGFPFGAVGPTPGFTSAQLKRLALLYVVASLRKGSWMIPGFHCVIDEGIPDGHDDPQNFDLAAWGAMVEQAFGEIRAAGI